MLCGQYVGKVVSDILVLVCDRILGGDGELESPQKFQLEA